MGFFDKLKEGLKKTKNNIVVKIDQVLVSFGKIDEELFNEIEEILITSDIGVNTSEKIIKNLKEKVKFNKVTDSKEVRKLLKEEITGILRDDNYQLNVNNSPAVILVVGVNGVGKTTSIAKIAHNLRKSGKKVLIAAGDTFRAAAIDQLDVWANRVGVELIKHKEGSDPAAVIFDAIKAVKSKNIDVLICDTAGRLHTKINLMNELKKINKVIENEMPQASKEVLLVLDATTGQNAISQAKIFKEAAGISGIILTKLDGTAKGGVVIAVKDEINIPIKLIGVGEGLEDLQIFNADDFASAIFD